MNKKNIIKLTLDIVMAILFIIFFKKDLISMKFHMISGILFGLFIIIHMILNRKWIINISKKLLDKKIKVRVKISYILSLLLFICIVGILVSGICILKAKTYDRIMFWKMLHFGTSYLSLALVGIHIGIYWTWIINMIKKIYSIQISKVIINISLIALLSFGIYNLYNQNYINKTINTMKYAIEHIKPQDIEAPEGNGYEKENNNKSYNEEKVSFINLISTYGSIVSIFSIGTYYTDKHIKSHKNKVKSM